jgi:hypothetical protein
MASKSADAACRRGRSTWRLSTNRMSFASRELRLPAPFQPAVCRATRIPEGNEFIPN